MGSLAVRVQQQRRHRRRMVGRLASLFRVAVLDRAQIQSR
jgi:hypothetical protein